MITTIAFDYAGVIAPGPMMKWIKEHPLETKKHKVYDEHSKRWDMGEVTLEEFYKIAFAMTGVLPEKVLETFYDTASVNTDVLDIVKALKNNYKVALFSNNVSYLVKYVLEKENVLSLFDNVLISSDYKMVKPNRDFFEKLLEVTNAQKSEIIFIDDTKNNVEAGNDFGIRSFLFTNSTSLKNDLHSVGVLI